MTYEILIHHLKYEPGSPVYFEVDDPSNQFVVLDAVMRAYKNYVVVAEVSAVEFDDSPDQ